MFRSESRKMDEKWIEKWPFVRWKNLPNYGLCNEFKVFAILEKIEKSMQKWLPKVMKHHSKWSPGAPRVDLLIIFIDFGRNRKNFIFWWGFRATKKLGKSTPGAPNGRKNAPDQNLGGGPVARGSWHSRKRNKRRRTRARDHTRQRAEGPANIILYHICIFPWFSGTNSWWAPRFFTLPRAELRVSSATSTLRRGKCQWRAAWRKCAKPLDRDKLLSWPLHGPMNQSPNLKFPKLRNLQKF